MTYPLFWTARDLGDDLAMAADLLNSGQPQIYYDYFGALTPEEAELPLSYWSRKRILFCVRESSALRGAHRTLSRMKLEDLRACALRQVGVRPTGRIWCDAGWKAREWRRTMFYCLDADWIGRLAEAASA